MLKFGNKDTKINYRGNMQGNKCFIYSLSYFVFKFTKYI